MGVMLKGVLLKPNFLWDDIIWPLKKSRGGWRKVFFVRLKILFGMMLKLFGS
jgi:hypothetical protein